MRALIRNNNIAKVSNFRNVWLVNNIPIQRSHLKTIFDRGFVKVVDLYNVNLFLTHS
jgi:hypothetical protein